MNRYDLTASLAVLIVLAACAGFIAVALAWTEHPARPSCTSTATTYECRNDR